MVESWEDTSATLSTDIEGTNRGVSSRGEARKLGALRRGLIAGWADELRALLERLSIDTARLSSGVGWTGDRLVLLSDICRLNVCDRGNPGTTLRDIRLISPPLLVSVDSSSC